MSTLERAWRSLRRSPGFSAISVLSLAMGLGVSVAFYSLVDAAYLSALPFQSGDRLVQLYSRSSRGPGQWRPYTSCEQVRYFAQYSRTLDAVAAAYTDGYFVSTVDGPMYVVGAHATSGLFATFGARPLLGRDLSESDVTPGAEPSVVLGFDLWRRQFGADSALIGRVVRINGRDTRVIGVAAPRFDYPYGAKLWTSMNWPRGSGSAANSCQSYAVARVRRDESRASVSTELTLLASNLTIDSSLAAGPRIRAVPLREFYVESLGIVTPLRRIGSVLFGLILLTCCSNLAGLIVARGMLKERDVATRLALGAPRSSVALTIVAESVLICIAAGVLALLISGVAIRVVSVRYAFALPSWLNLRVSPSLLAFGFVVSLASGVFAGLVPALQLSAASPMVALAVGNHGSSWNIGRRRLAAMLVTIEIALAFSFAAIAGAFGMRLLREHARKTGFNYRHLLRAYVSLRSPASAADSGANEVIRATAREEPLAIRAFGSVAWGSVNGYLFRDGVTLDDGRHPSLSSDLPHAARVGVVSPSYFATLEIPLLAGRLPSVTEAPLSADAVVISERAARDWFGSESAIGRRLRLDSLGPSPRWQTVIGVVGDVRDQIDVQLDAPVTVYRLSATPSGSTMQWFVRGRQAAALDASRLRQALRGLVGEQGTYVVEPMEQRIGNQVANLRRPFLFFVPATFFTMLLAALGCFAIAAQTARSRLREYGIRRALGAPSSKILTQLAAESSWMGLGGVVLGMLITIVLRALLSPPGRPLFELGVGALVSAGALVAAAMAAANMRPARQALRSDPARVLRQD